MARLVYPLARDLRDAVTFERRSAMPSELGGAGDWETLIDRRAAKLQPYVPRRGDPEHVIADYLQGVAMFMCWVRWDSLTSTLQFSDRMADLRGGKSAGGEWSRLFNIRLAQDMDGRKRWMVMILDIGVASG